MTNSQDPKTKIVDKPTSSAAREGVAKMLDRLATTDNDSSAKRAAQRLRKANKAK